MVLIIRQVREIVVKGETTATMPPQVPSPYSMTDCPPNFLRMRTLNWNWGIVHRTLYFKSKAQHYSFFLTDYIIFTAWIFRVSLFTSVDLLLKFRLKWFIYISLLQRTHTNKSVQKIFYIKTHKPFTNTLQLLQPVFSKDLAEVHHFLQNIPRLNTIECSILHTLAYYCS